MDKHEPIKIGMSIYIKPLLTEEELLPTIYSLSAKSIKLEYNYIDRGVQASLDIFTPVVALYMSSETFRSLIQNGLYDLFKLHFLKLCKIFGGKKYIRMQSQKVE